MDANYSKLNGCELVRALKERESRGLGSFNIDSQHNRSKNFTARSDGTYFLLFDFQQQQVRALFLTTSWSHLRRGIHGVFFP